MKNVTTPDAVPDSQASSATEPTDGSAAELPHGFATELPHGSAPEPPHGFAVEPPHYLPYPPLPAPPVLKPGRRRVLAAVTIGWAVLLLVTGVWYGWHGRPSARDQTTISSARPDVDRAVEDLVRAAGSGVLPAFSGFDKVEDCSVTPIRTGAKYRRLLWLYTPEGTEPALLDRIAHALPARYAADVQHADGGATHEFSADAGNYVAITNRPVRPGLVTLRVDTGCRPLGEAPETDPATPVPLAGLGAGGAVGHTLPCGLRTTQLTGVASAALGQLPGTDLLVQAAGAYASRSGIAAHTEDDGLVVTVTAGQCP
jgi:hypothetical protein